MSDIDFAFNNYCIACDKLCPANSIYCSESCKVSDEQSSHHVDHFDHHDHSDIEMVSPLLTPSLYQHYSHVKDVNDLPLLLTSKSDDEISSFDLNYPVAQFTQLSNITDHLPSTSHNYRKWLTACL